MGVRLSGDAARVLIGEKQVGNLYRWQLEGVDGDWTASAKKYRLADGEAEREMRFQFFIGQLEITGTGRITTDVIADGDVHRAPVCVKGTSIWIQQPTPA